MKRYIISAATVILLGVGLYFLCSNRSTGTQDSPQSVSGSASDAAVSDATEQPELLPEDLNSILDNSDTVPLDTIPGSYTVLVNRIYLLPSSYIPANLIEPKIRFSFSYPDDKRKLRKVAALALEQLFNAGKKRKIYLYGVSGYRSYQRQKEIYDRNVALRGKKATDSVSALPGSSEHQTGLTIDVSARSVSYRLDQSFGDTKEGRWLAKNAHTYGYIIRYPYGKSKITGYNYEPWHIRYVGVTVATYLYENSLTLEEYYGVSCNEPEDNTGVDVEEPDKVHYATPKPVKTPTVSSTKKPKSTKKPTKTKKPVKTKKPAVTKEPQATKKAATPAPTNAPSQVPETPEPTSENEN